MTVTVKQVQNAFELLFGGLLDRDFSKTQAFKHWGERDLLPLARCFLLGYFGRSVSPEHPVRHPLAESGEGQVDFMIDGVAVEFVVRAAEAERAKLYPSSNESELAKLMKHSDDSLLVLLDFSPDPFDPDHLRQLFDDASLGLGLGRGNSKTRYQLSYYYLESGAVARRHFRISGC